MVDCKGGYLTSGPKQKRGLADTKESGFLSNILDQARYSETIQLKFDKYTPLGRMKHYIMVELGVDKGMWLIISIYIYEVRDGWPYQNGVLILPTYYVGRED